MDICVLPSDVWIVPTNSVNALLSTSTAYDSAHLSDEAASLGTFCSFDTA